MKNGKEGQPRKNIQPDKAINAATNSDMTQLHREGNQFVPPFLLNPIDRQLFENDKAQERAIKKEGGLRKKADRLLRKLITGQTEAARDFAVQAKAAAERAEDAAEKAEYSKERTYEIADIAAKNADAAKTSRITAQMSEDSAYKSANRAEDAADRSESAAKTTGIKINEGQELERSLNNFLNNSENSPKGGESNMKEQINEKTLRPVGKAKGETPKKGLFNTNNVLRGIIAACLLTDAGLLGAIVAQRNDNNASEYQITIATPKPSEAAGTPRLIETLPTKIPEVLKPEYGTPIALATGEIEYISKGTVISGDIKVNNSKFYDDLSNTGDIYVFTNDSSIKTEALYGASGRTGLKTQAEIDAVIQQQAMATFGSIPEKDTIFVRNAQTGQVIRTIVR